MRKRTKTIRSNLLQLIQDFLDLFTSQKVLRRQLQFQKMEVKPGLSMKLLFLIVATAEVNLLVVNRTVYKFLAFKDNLTQEISFLPLCSARCFETPGKKKVALILTTTDMPE